MKQRPTPSPEQKELPANIGYPKPSKTVKKKKKVKNERKQLIRICDDLVRQIVFLTEDRCFVTGVRAGRWHPQDNPNGLQLSHYVSRTVYPLRWNLKNCHLTTAAVNYRHEHDQLPYTLSMIEKSGNTVLRELQSLHDEYRMRNKTMTTVQIREIKEELFELFTKYTELKGVKEDLEPGRTLVKV